MSHSSAALLPPEGVELSPDAPLWEWAYDAISHRAGEMLQHVEGVRVGEDIEAVHDMRVGSRRLVAAMRVFQAAFPERAFRRLLREARDVTRQLGSVRDLDVLIDHFERLRAPAAAELRAGIDYFLALRRRERDRARRPMLEALDALVESDYPARLQRYLRQEAQAYAVGLGPRAVRGVSLGPVEGETPFRRAAPPLLDERYRELYAFEEYVEHPEAEEQLHEMRIKAKWLRYTMELFAPAYADRLKGPLGVVKSFQEMLGDLHDADVRRYLLREMLDAPLDPRGLEDLGLLTPAPVEASLRRLLDREEKERQGIYAAFAKEWKKLARRGFAASCLERIHSPDA